MSPIFLMIISNLLLLISSLIALKFSLIDLRRSFWTMFRPMGMLFIAMNFIVIFLNVLIFRDNEKNANRLELKLEASFEEIARLNQEVLKVSKDQTSWIYFEPVVFTSPSTERPQTFRLTLMGKGPAHEVNFKIYERMVADGKYLQFVPFIEGPTKAEEVLLFSGELGTVNYSQQLVRKFPVSKNQTVMEYFILITTRGGEIRETIKMREKDGQWYTSIYVDRLYGRTLEILLQKTDSGFPYYYSY